MARILRIVGAVVAGLVLGSVVNMALVMLGARVVQAPAGADVATMEGLKASIHLFEPRHFVFPFIAHAMGTFAGAFVAGLLSLAGSTRMSACIVGGFFLLGGIANVMMLPSPVWFNVVDLLLAYAPATGLGLLLAERVRPNPPVAA